MGWVKEFGREYDVPLAIQSIVNDGISQDLSWHNDTAPSFGFINDAPGTTALDIRLWVDHPDPSEREKPKSDRYAVQVFSNDKVLTFEPFTAAVPAKEYYRKMLVKYLSPNDIRKFVSDWTKSELNAWYEREVGYEPSKDDPSIPLPELKNLVAEMIWLHLGGSESALK